MKVKVSCLLLTSVLIWFSAPAQWMQTSGPCGDQVWSVAHIDTTLFLATGQVDTAYRVFKSTDLGASWILASDGLPKVHIKHLFRFGRSLFLGTMSSGVFRSTDEGISWTEANSGIPKHPDTDFQSINGFAAIDDRLFAIYDGPSFGGIVVSTDNGTSWSSVHTPYCTSLWTIISMGTSLFVAAGGSGVFRSTDNGSNWQPVNNGLTQSYVCAFAVSGTNLYAGTVFGSHLFVTTDQGLSWRALDQPRSLPFVHCLLTVGDTLIAGTAEGLFVLPDTTTGWIEVDTEFRREIGVQSLALVGVNIFAGNGGGLFRSTDNGATWTYASNGLMKVPVASLAASNSTLFAATYAGVLLSTGHDGGWSLSTIPFKDFSCMLYTGDGLFAGTSQGVFLSRDHGVNWIRVIHGMRDTSVSSLTATGTILFAGTRSGDDRNGFKGSVYASSNSGTSWTLADSGIGRGGINCLSGSGTNVFAGSDSGFFRSNTSGGSWIPAGAGLPYRSVHHIVASGACVLAECGEWISVGEGLYRSGGIFRSTDNGGVWTSASNGLPRLSPDSVSFDRITCLLVHGQNIFAGTEGSGLFVSSNDGDNWVPMDLGLTTRTIHSLAVLGGSLFAGTPRGVWHRPLSEMTTSVDPQTSQLSHGFSLHQNYPNPFNPSTTIKYELPKSTMVRLSVYDMLGREVAVLVNKREDAGVHQTKFDASNYASGVYLYRLQAGDLLESRKLIILR